METLDDIAQNMLHWCITTHSLSTSKTWSPLFIYTYIYSHFLRNFSHYLVLITTNDSTIISIPLLLMFLNSFHPADVLCQLATGIIQSVLQLRLFSIYQSLMC